MSTTLTYGRKTPSTNDASSSWMDDLADNIVLDDAHDHDGTDSPRIAIGSRLVTTQSIASGSWVATSGGRYRQEVTLSGSLTFDGVSMEFRLSTGTVIYPTIEKTASTKYYIYTNDNTIDVTALYTT